MLAASLATILFACSLVFGYRASKMIGGSEANFWRLAVGTLALGVWSYTMGIGLGGDAMPYFFVSGIVGFGVGDVALYQALPRLGSRLTMVISQCLGPPFGIMIEWGWLGTRLSIAQTVFVFIILAGVALALSPDHLTQHDPRQVRIGIFSAVLAAFGGALGAVLSRKAFDVAQTAGEPIDGANAAFQRIIAGLLVAGVWLLIVRWHKSRTDAGRDTSLEFAKRKWRAVWFLVVANGLTGSVLGVSCMLWALKTVPTGIVLAIVALTPLTVIPLSIKFEGEKLTLRSLAGGVVAVGGVIGLSCVRP